MSETAFQTSDNNKLTYFSTNNINHSHIIGYPAAVQRSSPKITENINAKTIVYVNQMRHASRTLNHSRVYCIVR